MRDHHEPDLTTLPGLRAAIDHHLQTNRLYAVNLSIPRHSVIACVLHELVYSPQYREKGRSIQVVFSDGSKPEPFPVGCFVLPPEPPPLPKEKRLHVGLMSFRHPELDYLVDLYITRNQELAEEPTMADEEQLAFTRTVEALSDPILDEGAELWVFHTGLEPMVVGFYRGAVAVLRAREERRHRQGRPLRNLIIRPHFYMHPRNDEEDEPDLAPLGVKYRPRSYGAQLESYRPGDPWW